MVAEDRALALQFLTMGKLNPSYNEGELLEMLGRRAMLLKDSILEQSPFLQTFMNKARLQGMETGLERGLEQGLVQGLEKGLEKGLEQGRKNLLDVLVKLVDLRFKGVVIPAKVKGAELEELKAGIDQLLAAPDNGTARKILRGL